MIILEQYLNDIKKDKDPLTEGISVSGVIGSVRDFINHHAPRRTNEMNNIRDNFNHKLSACDKYFIKHYDEEEVTTKVHVFKPTGSSQELQYTRKGNVHSGIYACRLSATVKYYRDIVSLLKRSSAEMCRDNTDKQKCQQWINSKIDTYSKKLKYALFSREFLGKK